MWRSRLPYIDNSKLFPFNTLSDNLCSLVGVFIGNVNEDESSPKASNGANNLEVVFGMSRGIPDLDDSWWF